MSEAEEKNQPIEDSALLEAENKIIDEIALAIASVARQLQAIEQKSHKDNHEN